MDVWKAALHPWTCGFSKSSNEPLQIAGTGTIRTTSTVRKPMLNFYWTPYKNNDAMTSMKLFMTSCRIAIARDPVDGLIAKMAVGSVY